MYKPQNFIKVLPCKHFLAVGVLSFAISTLLPNVVNAAQCHGDVSDCKLNTTNELCSASYQIANGKYYNCDWDSSKGLCNMSSSTCLPVP